MDFLTILNRITSFLITTSLFLAINGSFKVFFSGSLFHIFTFNTSIITFLTTFGTYGLNKLTDLKEDSINTPERAKTIKKIELIFKLSVACSFFLSLALGFFESIFTLPILLFPLLLGILYSVKFSTKIPRLKDITGVKNLTIALSWAVGSTFFPVVYLTNKNLILIILVFYFFFLKSYINSIIFDFRDMEGDRMNGVRTIPVSLGRKKTKMLLLILNSTLLLWLLIFMKYFMKYFYVLFFSITYGYWYIMHFCGYGAKPGKSLDLLVDGEFILISVLAFFVKNKFPF
jgi:4-hydroxybenzoate polyprenyltransferase